MNITEEMKMNFKQHLIEDERSNATISKYMHDVECFERFANGKEVNKALVIDYKNNLSRNYELSSANSMLAALNSFFRFVGLTDCIVKQFHIQRKIYCEESKELSRNEYVQLANAARRKGDMRLFMLIQTICGTGIRVSELKFFTVESVRSGKVTITCKNKTRTVFIVTKLREKLLEYANSKNISSGCIFVTKSGKNLNRSNVWRELKQLCKSAGVSPTKVFPHNLRHLFARTFYRMEKDIAKLADLLGHSSIDTTRVYIISTGAEHRQQMENMRLII